ncbi:hypothetical protein AVEN_158863-1 [Araneus ventricosus]|uniref:Uncharacterized protein n=1 Tax=Araneus ventricosus TaxID=182803 RepID=A0A4Y2E5W7_ARAVE|nr:hypothetical protein AVEN_158863-1 [Araneus ventricosus]
MLPPSASCIVLFVFSSRRRLVLWKTINAAVSCHTLRRRIILTSRVVLNNKNPRPHNCVVAQLLLELFKWGVSDRPVYRRDLATSDFHLFNELKDGIGSQSFQKNEELQSNVISHYWREPSSKRGSETWSSDTINA